MPIIIPFIVSATMFFPYITGKNFTFRIVVEIIFAAWVVLALMDAKYRPRFSWLLAAIALFVVVVGIADVQGANFFKSFWSNFERMEGYIAILHLFAYFIVASTVLNTEKLWTAFWYSSLATSVVVAIIGIKPILAILPNMTNLPRSEATFGNPIYLAVYTLFHVFIAIILMVRWRGTHWHQVILGAAAILLGACMVFTLTRGTVLGALGGALVTTLIVALFERRQKILRYASIAVLAIMLILVGGAYAIKDTDFARSNSLVGRFTQYDLSGGTIKARFMNWGMAWQGVKERPVLGWGQDNYEYVFSKYYNPNMYQDEPWFDRTHNIFFDWLIAAGFAGLIAYLLIPVTLLAHLWGYGADERKFSLRALVRFTGIRELFTKRDHTFSVVERALWTGLLAAYMFHNMFVFDNIVSYIFYFSVLAYLHFRMTEGAKPLWDSVSVPKETIVPVVLPVVAVVLIAVLYFANIPGIRTSQHLIQALSAQQAGLGSNLEEYKTALAYDQLGRQEVREQVTQAAAQMARNTQVDPNTKQAYIALARTEMEKEVARNPDSARLRLFLATFYSTLGEYDTAYDELVKARELTPTKQTALFQLGEIQLIRGNTDDALAIFKEAYELTPKFEEGRKLYAYALITAGKDKEAVDLLQEGFGTVLVDDTRLMRAWTQAKRYDIVSKLLEARIAKDPNDVQQIVSLAAAYKELGDKDKAVKLLNDVSVAHPEYKEQMDNFIKEIRGY